MPTVTSNGASTKAPSATGSTYRYGTEDPYKGAGWIVFAAVMFVVAAILNFIWGIAAVADSRFFVGDATYILSGLNTWGWVAIGFGAIQLLAALSIFRGGAFGRWFGIIAAGVAAVVAMMMIPAYPLWSLTLVAIDILVIYGLAVYGGRPELTE